MRALCWDVTVMQIILMYGNYYAILTKAVAAALVIFIDNMRTA